MMWLWLAQVNATLLMIRGPGLGLIFPRWSSHGKEALVVIFKHVTLMSKRKRHDVVMVSSGQCYLVDDQGPRPWVNFSSSLVP